MDRQSGSMKIMSSQHLLAQSVVTTCGHVEEGPSADELHLGILGIMSGNVKTHGHMNAELPKSKMPK
jgi:hypothetical protein